jgi:alkanesulfonate monooxygenase SsuD/methylene tetrahydromethanopterin reductase-like flavin-dependent oxidoreductase (luciferase family)
MRVSVFVNAPASETGKAQHALMQDAVAIAQLAEICGFERFLVTEHHTTTLGATPDPMQLLAAVAARTSRIGVGTAAVILGMSHPLRVAETCSQLDAISGGRASLGLARGFHRGEFAAFDAPQLDPQAFFEAVGIVRELLTGEMLRPRPMSTIPVSVAVSSPESYEQAGREGLPILTNPYFIEPGEFGRLIDRYRSAAGEAGKNGHVTAHVVTVVAPTDSQALRIGESAVDDYLRMRAGGRFTCAELTRSGRVAVGSPRTVSALLEEYAGLGVDEIAVNPLLGIAPCVTVRQTVELLAARGCVDGSDLAKRAS